MPAIGGRIRDARPQNWLLASHHQRRPDAVRWPEVLEQVPARMVPRVAVEEGRTVNRLVVHNREPHDVYIGRPSVWGNPFRIGCDGTRADVIHKYRQWLTAQPILMERAKRELRGKVLGCWCAPQACHGDVLVEVANG